MVILSRKMGSVNFLLSHSNHTVPFIICICTIKLINLGSIFGGVFRLSSSLRSMCIKKMVMMHLDQTIVLFLKFNCYNGCILNIKIKCFPSSNSMLSELITQNSIFPKKKRLFCLLFKVLSCQIKKQNFLNLSLVFQSNAISDLATVCSVP